MAGEEQPDSLASPWEPSWLGLINLPQECCITAFHYMNSPLMGFTQFMLLRLGWGGKKKKQQRSASNDAGSSGRGRKKKMCVLFLKSDDFHVIFTKAFIYFSSFRHQRSCSIRSKR